MNRETTHGRRLWVFIVVVALLIIGVIVYFFITHNQVPRVHLIRIKRVTLENRVFASGTVRPTQRQVVQAQSLPGPIQSINVHEGQSVQKGTTLITFPNASQKAALQSAQVAVDAANRTLQNARQQYASAPSGFKPQFQGAVANAQTGYAQAEAQLGQAQAAYQATLVKANFDGTVLMVNPDGIASDGTPAPVLEVVSRQKQVVVQLSEVDAVQVHPGLVATITSDAYPNKQWNGTITQVAPYAATSTTGTGQVEVDIQVPVSFPVPIGYQTNARMVSATHTRVVAVPYDALVQQGDQYIVYVYQNGKAFRHTVQLGITSDTSVEVTSGVEAGQEVLLNPPANLQDGEGVSPVD